MLVHLVDATYELFRAHFAPRPPVLGNGGMPLSGVSGLVEQLLYLLRDQRARDLNRPAFKVLSDLFLAEAARRLPRSEEELLRVPGTSPMTLKKVGAQLLEAVRKGIDAEPPERPRPGGSNGQRWRRGDDRTRVDASA